MDELRLEASESDHVTRLDRVELSAFQELMLVQLVLKYSEGQPRRVDRHVHRAKHVWYRADVVLVTVRYKYSAHLVDILFKIAYVGDHKVDSEHIVVGERDSAVYHYYIVLVFENCKVFSYFIESAQHHHSQL